MQKLLKIFSGFLLFMSSVSSLSFAGTELLSAGQLRPLPYKESYSLPIDVSEYQNIFVGVVSGQVICTHFTVRPPNHVAYVIPYFSEDGEIWYKQNRNCVDACGAQAVAKQYAQFRPLGRFIKIALEPRDIDGGSVECRGELSYEIRGER